MRVLAGAVLFAATLLAQGDPLGELAGRARSAPPEFAADLLIQLAGRSELPAQRRIEWLEDAFRLAGAARRKMPAGADIGTGTFQSTADLSVRRVPAHSGLDTLSLQSRAVIELLPLNRERAMIFLREIQLTDTASTCDAPAGNLSVYYLTVEAAYQKGFTTEERADGRDVDFLIAAVMALKSPEGLSGVMNFVRLPLDDAAFQRLLSAFTAALRVVRRSDASLGVGLTNSLIQVIDRAQNRKISVFPLFAAVREFLVRSLSGSHCALPALSGGTIPMEAAWFNETLVSRGENDTAQLRPIEVREVQPAETRTAEALRQTQASEDAAHLLDAVKRLGATGKEERGSAQFEDRVREILREVNEWRREHIEGEPLYVTIAAGIYRQLSTIVVSQDLRRTAVREHLDLLHRTRLRDQAPQAWAGETDALLSSVRVNDLDLEWFRSELQSTGDAVIPLYLDIAELLARARI